MSMKAIDPYKSIVDALMSFIDGLGEGEDTVRNRYTYKKS
jgi:hypothetical protein